MNGDTDYVREFYRRDAEEHGLSPFTAVHDVVLRDKETKLIKRFLFTLERVHGGKSLRILDAGCGNGYTLSELSLAFPDHRYWGIDASTEMVRLALRRDLPSCGFQVADVRFPPFPDETFSAVITQRCLINLLDWQDKEKAIRGVHEVLRDDGYFLMIEGFYDGLENNNRARRECGLAELTEPQHNRYFDKATFLGLVDGLFEVVNPESFDPDEEGVGLEANFASSHYFISRVLHALVTKGEQIKNTEFVKFFSFLSPIGNYAPIQALILQKIGNAGITG